MYLAQWYDPHTYFPSAATGMYLQEVAISTIKIQPIPVNSTRPGNFCPITDRQSVSANLTGASEEESI